MKRCVLILLLLVAVNSAAQNRYALLVGIGDYPQESGWRKIHGDNDVEIVKDFLIKQGMKEQMITCLTNAEATKANIMSALDRIKEDAQKGDVIYIHFSGHGQQVTDLDGDEEDGFDEAWISYDANKSYVQGKYEGQNHIIDDELNAYLSGLRSKIRPTGKIVVVADACHSGSGSRGVSTGEDDFVRGANKKFIPLSGANVIEKEPPVHWLYVGACKPYLDYDNRVIDFCRENQKEYIPSIALRRSKPNCEYTLRLRSILLQSKTIYLTERITRHG